MSPTILTYHHVAESPDNHPHRGLFVSPASFAWQMDFLRRSGFTITTLDHIRTGLLGKTALPRRTVAITFDDGYEDNFTYAYPILKRYGFPATVFMVSGEVRSEADSAQNPNSCTRHLSLNQLRLMAASGITIGSHSVTHRRLASIPINEAQKEIAGSKEELETLLNCRVQWFSYPCGNFNKEVVEAVRDAGYIGAVSAIRDNRICASQLFYLPRIMVMSDVTPFHFRYYFSPLYHFIHQRKNKRRWGNYV